MSNIQVSLLVGLPGAGKTTLCNNLLNSTSTPFNYIHVCFDKLFSLSEQGKFVKNAKLSDLEHVGVSAKMDEEDLKEVTGSDERFKDARTKVLGKLEQMILFIIENCSDLDRVSSFATDLKFDMSIASCPDEKPRFVLLVDDNLYYRSMRRDYYALAAKHKTCFSEVFVDVSLREALEINEARPREQAVSGAVVEAMWERLEVPDPVKHRWERRNVVVKRGSQTVETGDESLKLVCGMFRESFTQPVLDLELIESREREASQSRLITASTFSHTADLVLRKLVKECVMHGGLLVGVGNAANDNVVGPQRSAPNVTFDKKTTARLANVARQQLLTKIQSGLVTITNDLTNEETYSLLSDLFGGEFKSVVALSL